MKATFCKLSAMQGQGFHLSPHDKEAKECLSKFSEGEIVVLELKKTRNPKYHRLAFAMMNALFDMVDEKMPFYNWRKLMLIKSGYFTALGKVSVDGAVTQAIVADSLNYETMDDIEFQRCMEDFLQAFINKYEKTITFDELHRAVTTF